MQKISSEMRKAYIFIKIGVAAGIVCIVLVGAALWLWLVEQDFLMAKAVAFVAVFPLVFALMLIGNNETRLMRLQQNYNWYKEQYPDKNRNGRPLCHSCNSPKIAVRNLMNRSYMRVHICTVCGTTLYYSPE